MHHRFFLDFSTLIFSGHFEQLWSSGIGLSAAVRGTKVPSCSRQPEAERYCRATWLLATRSHPVVTVVPKVMGKKKHKRFIIIVQKTYWNSHFGVIIIYLLPDKLVQVGILSGEYWRISIWKWNGKEMDLELELGWWVLIFWVNSARKNTTDESADIEIFWLLARLYRSNPPMATFKQYTAMGWYGCGQNSMSMTLWPEDFGRVHPQPSPFKFSSLCR